MASASPSEDTGATAKRSLDRISSESFRRTGSGSTTTMSGVAP
jgi:hypothetical protein